MPFATSVQPSPDSGHRIALVTNHKRKLVRTALMKAIKSMDHLPHPFSGQSQTTHHQPHLHRRARPSALRPQGRLPRRILRRCSSHRASANLRGYLCPFARRRNSRAHHHPTAAGKSTVTRKPGRDQNSPSTFSLPVRKLPQPDRNPAHPVFARSAIELDSSLSAQDQTREQCLKNSSRRAFFRRCNDARMDCPAALGWHSAPSTTGIQPARGILGGAALPAPAMKAFLLIRALAREVPKTPNIISSKSTLTSTTTTAVPHQLQQTRPRHNRLHNRGRAALQSPRNPYQNDWGFSPCADL